MTRRRWLLAAALVLFAVGIGWGYLRLWRTPPLVESSRVRLHLIDRRHTHIVQGAAFSPRADLVASGSVDATARVWAVEDGRTVQTFRHPAGVTDVAFSPDGQLLATTSYDSQVRLWRIADGALLRTLGGHAQTAWCVAF